MRQLTLPFAVAVLFALSGCGKSDSGSTSASTPAPAPAPATAAAPSPAPAPAPAPTPAPAAAAAGTQMASAGGKGQAVYSQICVACHTTGVAGSPKLGDKAEWGPRIAQGKDVLYAHAIKGFQGKKGVMPAKGGNPGLSDDDVKAAVDYIVSQAQ